jgi:quercetin dioxygenase-like cupin family protein
MWSGPGEGEHIWLPNSYATILVPGEAVDGRFSLMEFGAAHHMSPPLHTHPQDETFFMLDGVMTFQLGEERLLLEAGATAVVPRGVRHTWRADSESVRMLVVSTPAGIDRLFRDLGFPAPSPTLPPPGAPERSLEEIEEICRLHRHDNYGPPIGPDE